MLWMIAGLALFVAAHGFTAARRARVAAIQRLGLVPYRVLYSLVSLVAIALVVYGFAAWRAEGPPQLWYPPVWTRHLALLLMLFASIAFVAYATGGRIALALKHPMLIAVKTWAVAHLLANGDLATIVLSAVILGWAVFARISMKWRLPEPRALMPGGWVHDAGALGGGVALYLVLVYLFHPYVIGVPVMPV